MARVVVIRWDDEEEEEEEEVEPKVEVEEIVRDRWDIVIDFEDDAKDRYEEEIDRLLKFLFKEPIDMSRKWFYFREGWKIIEEGVRKLKLLFEGEPVQFTYEESVKIYTTVYTICLAIDVGEGKGTLLRDTLQRWSNHKKMVWRLSRWFSDSIKGRPPIRKVYQRRNTGSITSSGTIALRPSGPIHVGGGPGLLHSGVSDEIDEEREGDQIDRPLLKSVLINLFGAGSEECKDYTNDFDTFMLDDIALYYSKKAAIWISEFSYVDYIKKAEDCLEKEKERVYQYLHSSSEEKLLGEEDDPIKMYWLFYRIPQGLDTIANIFKKVVTAEGKSLVEHSKDSLRNRNVFWKKVIGLHDKHLGYVTKYFKNNILFREIFLGKAFQVVGKGVCIIFMSVILSFQALDGAFNVFCNENVGNISSAKMLAAYCHDILKRGREELIIDTCVEDNHKTKYRDYVTGRFMCLSVVTRPGFTVLVTSDKVSNESISRRIWLWYAHRLLYHEIRDNDSEKSMIAELSSHYGILFRARMEKMKADLTLAENMQINFEEYLNLNPQKSPEIAFNVTALDSTFWPSYISPIPKLPAELVGIIFVLLECLLVF
ncbi:hypothetical protein Scep_013517 [Stephania cephalantha]|uniref:Cullin family profile domain-containing protein n=1 Tax=Stephania cephalantha TaxID=152367 RepID=A0AAP0P8I6_9MAGN